MIVLKSLASHGDFRTWTAYACSGDGHGQAVRAEIAQDLVAVTVDGRVYECERNPADTAGLCVGDIRGLMIAALALDARIMPQA